VVRNATLIAVSEDKPCGRADNGGSDSEPSKGHLLLSDGRAHEDDEQGESNRENLGSDKLSDRRSIVNGSRFRLLPGDGAENDDEVREHPEEVTPTGGSGGGPESEEVDGIGKDGGEKDESENERE